MKVIHIAFVMGSCLVIRSAAAEPAQTTAMKAPPATTTQSVLPNVLSTSAGLTLDERIDFTNLDSEAEIPQLLGYTLHGQYIARSGLGAYLALPGVVSPEGVALGNAELGGLYVIRSGGLDVYLRGGLALEQTNIGDGGEATLFAHIVPRLADVLAAGPGQSWGRAGAGMRLNLGSIVIGGSGGVDVPLDAEEDDDLRNGVLHLSGSIGIAGSRFGLAVGATMLQDLDRDAEDDNLVGLQATGDVAVGRRMRIFGTFGFLPEAEVHSVGAGVRVRL